MSTKHTDRVTAVFAARLGVLSERGRHPDLVLSDAARAGEDV